MPTVGEKVTVLQTFGVWDDFEGRDKPPFKTYRIPAVVVYVRKRGDCQVATENGQKWWVDTDGSIHGARGVVRVKGWRKAC